MADVRNVDREMKVQPEENFQKTILDEKNEFKKRHGTKIVGLIFFLCYLIAYIIRIMESKFKQIYYSNDR